MTEVFSCADPDQRDRGVRYAAEAVKEGDLVVLPTDTLYGVGCDAFNAEAVGRLLAAKHRGPDMPVPVLVGSWTTIRGLVREHTDRINRLVEAFWPGALSFVAPVAPSLPLKLGHTENTIMLRMPLHPVAIDLLRQTGPMAVSSANISGQPPATTVEEARSQLGQSVSVYLDGGSCPIGEASTILDITGPTPKILRHGAVPAERIAEVLGLAVGDLD